MTNIILKHVLQTYMSQKIHKFSNEAIFMKHYFCLKQLHENRSSYYQILCAYPLHIETKLCSQGFFHHNIFVVLTL